MTDVEQRQRTRDALLDALYDATDGGTSAIVKVYDVGNGIRLDRQRSKGIRKALGAGIATLVLALLYDVAKAIALAIAS